MTTRDGANTRQWEPRFSPWRHGGWCVDNLRYPSGAVGCVSRNYPDRKWRIVCDPRPFDERPAFPNRIAAAHGERELIASLTTDQQPGRETEAESDLPVIASHTALLDVLEAAKALVAMNNCNYDRAVMRSEGGFQRLEEAVGRVEVMRN